MSNIGYKRAFAITAAIMLLAFLMLSPAAELYGEHDHSCSPNDCLICLVANSLSELRISFGAMLCTATILLFIYICEAMRFREVRSYASSPVALKTKITS